MLPMSSIMKGLLSSRLNVKEKNQENHNAAWRNIEKK